MTIVSISRRQWFSIYKQLNTLITEKYIDKYVELIFLFISIRGERVSIITL